MGRLKRIPAGILALVLLLAGRAAAEGRWLIPGGQLVGVAVKSEGLIYIGASDLGSTPSPARLAGLKSGDRIVSMNGDGVESTAALTNCVSDGKPVKLGVIRGEKAMDIEVSPGKDPRDGHYRIGAWVRASAAGVGTLTYIDPKTGEFGALGHAIEDPDARVKVPVKQGLIYESEITGIVKGKKGDPGQLGGDFMERNRPVGTIAANGSAGIWGTYTAANVGNSLFPDGVQTGNAVQGKAQLIASLDENGPKLYDVRILRVETASDTRNLVLEVTDETLLNLTGGIVQGMSGSPIIQNGKLVGAVTHVLVDNPARGYGILIDHMLDAAA